MLSNTDLINTLFLTILSRYPTAAEMTQRHWASLRHGDRHARETVPIQDLVWSLYNKVDFVFNY